MDITTKNSLSFTLVQKAAVVIGMISISALAWVFSSQPLKYLSFPFASSTIFTGFIFVFIWTTMMTAMMLPSLIPIVLLFTPVSQSRSAHGQQVTPAPIFVAGYLATWALIGLGLYLMGQFGISLMGGWNPYLAGAALIVAGYYQLSRWKQLCLGHCRSPMDFLMYEWSDGYSGALLMGAKHGWYCVGCCWSLMLAQIALGMMNLGWMGLIATLIFIEKILPKGDQVAKLIGAGLIISGSALIFVNI